MPIEANYGAKFVLFKPCCINIYASYLRVDKGL